MVACLCLIASCSDSDRPQTMVGRWVGSVGGITFDCELTEGPAGPSVAISGNCTETAPGDVSQLAVNGERLPEPISQVTLNLSGNQQSRTFEGFMASDGRSVAGTMTFTPGGALSLTFEYRE